MKTEYLPTQGNWFDPHQLKPCMNHHIYEILLQNFKN